MNQSLTTHAPCVFLNSTVNAVKYIIIQKKFTKIKI